MNRELSKLNPKLLLFMIVGVIILAGVACQTGEVITPAEATARAKEARAVVVKKTATPGGKTSSGGDVIPSGSKASLVGKAYLINIYKEAGSTRILTQQEKGVEVEVEDVTHVGDKTWYLIKAPAGQGWVKAENLQPVEEKKKADASGGPQVGDIVYLTGKSYLINLYKEPGDLRIIAQQERGVAVEIKDITEYEGETWYLIDAPTGLGWVKAENITTEKPK
jgi:hypothetical protein